MNNKNRRKIDNVIVALESIKDDLDYLLDEESDKRDNYPENLYNTETYEQIETACDNIESSSSLIEEAMSLLEELL